MVNAYRLSWALCSVRAAKVAGCQSNKRTVYTEARGWRLPPAGGIPRRVPGSSSKRRLFIIRER
ncbi:hypothetical protein GCM10007157_20750 [Vreelandella hamiltonii]|uniref:Uncharacterized protein n=1 Tax=Vreelandella hamiltonii TaxID=502829 RepID=A0A8H9I2N4_9GAMM|nr:hypothetical protein GCM10007157_20750 [Halomonas hamiltonii]